MILGILIVFFPVITTFIFIYIYLHSLKKKRESFSEENKERLSLVKKKIKESKIIVIFSASVLCLVLILPNIINTISKILERKNSISNNSLFKMVQPVDIVNEIWNIFLKLEMFILIVIVVEIFVFKLYIKYTKKLNNEDKKFISNYYSGKTVLGIILAIINFIIANLVYFIVNLGSMPVL